MSYIDDKLNQMKIILEEIKRNQELLESKKQEIEKDFQLKKNELEQAYNINTKNLMNTRITMSNMAKEKSIKLGIPYLAEAYDELYAIEEQIHREYLNHKKRDATKTAEEIKSFYSKRFRESEKQRKIFEYIIKYYENLFPYLKDIRDDIINDNDLDFEQQSYKEDDKADPATFYLSADEYYKLTQDERNQMALDRYLKRNLSKIEIGKMYERYIGYLYEKLGYNVEYKGIVDGIDDLGRDLICTKENEIIIIQCKNWSQFKNIHEKHIFQFFGTVYEYRDNEVNKNESSLFISNVKGIFYTTTKLSDRAKRFSELLKIDIKDNFNLDKTYPMIKCNVNQITGEKIYHLPFDQQYDKVKIDYNLGECYTLTTKEAVALGFRRAKQWNSNNK